MHHFIKLHEFFIYEKKHMRAISNHIANPAEIIEKKKLIFYNLQKKSCQLIDRFNRLLMHF